jgi:hypothetical protein
MLDLRCHFIGMFCRFVVMLLSFICHLFVIYLSFICHLFVILGMENAKKYT